MPKFVEDNGILLPEFLFYFDKSKSKSISPKANFNPATALNGGGFESSTSPSKQPVKRPIIIDQTSLPHLDYGEQIAFIKRLKIAGFKVLLRVTPPQNFYELDEDLTGVEQLQNLGIFNEDRDYPTLAQHKVARDKALILNHQDQFQINDILRSFSNTTYTGELFGNDWKFEFRSLPNELQFGKIPHDNINFLLFHLSRSSPEQQEAAIKTYYELERELIKKTNPNISSGSREEKRRIDEETLAKAFILLSTTKHPDIERIIYDNINLYSCTFEDLTRNYKTFSETVNFNESHYYFGHHTLSCAVKLFPEHRNEIFFQYAKQNLVGSDSYNHLKTVDDINECIANLPHFTPDIIAFTKEKLEGLRSLAAFRTFGTKLIPDHVLDQDIINEEERQRYHDDYLMAAIVPEFNDKDLFIPLLEIVIDIYEKKDIGKSHKSEKLSDTLSGRDVWDQAKILSSLARAENQSGSDDFYEKQLLKHLDQNITESIGKIKPNELFNNLLKIIKGTSSTSRTAEKISYLIFDRTKDLIDANAGTYDYPYDLLLEIIKSCPQRQEEISSHIIRDVSSHLKYFNAHKRDLPAKIRNRIYDLHYPIISDLDLILTKEEIDTANYSKNPNAKPRQTYLEVVDLDSEEKEMNLTRMMNSDKFRDVTTLRFLRGNVEQINLFLFSVNRELADHEKDFEEDDISVVASMLGDEEQRKRFKKSLKHVILSKMEGLEPILQTLKDLGISHEIIDDSNYLGILDTTPEPAPSDRPDAGRAPIKISIADGATSENVDMEDTVGIPSFTMVSAGEVLDSSDNFTPQIRTHIINRDVTRSLVEEIYYPTNFREVANLSSITEADIERIKAGRGTSHFHYLFKQQLVAGVKTRLLSAHPEEEFTGLIGDVAGIRIEKGDDDFFYATSETNRILSYVTKAPNPTSHKTSFDRIPSNNPIKKIIDEYRNSPEYSSLASQAKTKAKYDPEHHKESMEQIFEERSGVCRHRVAAVEYKLRTNGVAPENFRIVDINRNHVVLEIKHGEKWVSVDLGGGSATLNQAAEDRVYLNLDALIPIQTTPQDVLDLEPKLEELAIETLKPSHVEDLAADSLTNEESSSAESRNSALPVINAAKEKAAEQRKINEANQRAIAKMAQSFLEIVKLRQVNDLEELVNLTTASNQNKILVVANDLKKHSNLFLGQGTSQGRRTFYIDTPEKIDLHRINLTISNDNHPPHLSKEGLLSEFLTYAATKPNPRPLLVINWSTFNPRERLALNTVIDRERKINGVAIDDSIQIIGLSDSASQDPSFLSRHNAQLESKVILPEIELENTNAKNVIDIQGFSNWRRQLFGKVVLNGGVMAWEKSPFVTALESRTNNFEICNLAPQAAEELMLEFSQAQALGKFNYHGHDILLPAGTTLSCNSNSFAFDKFVGAPEIFVAHTTTFDKAPIGSTLVNTQLFDLLLFDKRIDNDHGIYHEEKGLIDNCTTQPLKLFISSDLSDSQWYCLLNQMQQKGLALELYLAPEVNLPNAVKFTEIAAAEPEEKIHSAIFASNDPSATLQQILTDTEAAPFAIVDVEDLTYQDLITKIDFEYDENGFKNFRESESQFLSKLRAGEKIILKGQFDADLLQMLEPVLTNSSEFAGISQNLTVIVEDKNCQAGEIYKPLKWLPQSRYQVETYERAPAATATTDPALTEAFNNSYDLTNSEAEAAEFIRVRKETFTKAINNSSLLRMTGHSGVGKSRLIKMFEAEDTSTTKVCRELSSFEEWANDKSDKRKILFIDESNIDDLHFTMFSQLQNGGAQRIFYQGKFYDLDGNHKVVFACNSSEYGGGRFEQKLFANDTIPEFRMVDFPASYIYEKILRESIYEKLAAEIKAELSEQNFKKICQEIIIQYQENDNETVRELQEKILIAINSYLDLELNPTIVVSPNYVSTNATKEVEEALLTALNIRQKQRDGIFPNKAIGLNGVLLEGDSGTGKSELIGAILTAKGIREIKLGEERDNDQQRFYKIDANLPLEQKREIIVHAFENGDVIWIDEINSCIDDGLEKILNAALTGDHPDGTRAEPKSGFMLISSVNSAGLEGRSIISPALLHRTIQPRVKNLKEYSCEDISKIINHWLKQAEKTSALYVRSDIRKQVCQNIASHFTKCLESAGGDDLNLRMLRDNLGKILPAHITLAQLQNKIFDFEPSPSVSSAGSVNLDIDSFVKAMTPTIILTDIRKISGSDTEITSFKPQFPETKIASDKFNYSSTARLDDNRSGIIDTLRETIAENKISNTLAAKIILSAIKNGGTKDENLLRSDLRSLGEETTKNSIRAQNLSSLFQEKMAKKHFLTGNQNSIDIVLSGKRPVEDLVGMRLKRLTPDYALDLLTLDLGPEEAKKHFKEICRNLGISKRTLLEDTSVSSTRTVMTR